MVKKLAVAFQRLLKNQGEMPTYARVAWLFVLVIGGALVDAHFKPLVLKQMPIWGGVAFLVAVVVVALFGAVSGVNDYTPNEELTERPAEARRKLILAVSLNPGGLDSTRLAIRQIGRAHV